MEIFSKVVFVLVIFAPCISHGSQKELWTQFRTGFMQKRIHQLSSVKQLLSKSRPNQLKVIKAAMTKIKEIVGRSRAVLESSGSVDLLPADAATRESLALTVENTCFACDFLLRFPDDVHDLLSMDKDLDVAFRWGLGFFEDLVTRDSDEDPLFDQGTRKMLNLSLMEMGIIEKTEDYQNNYAVRAKKNEMKKDKKIDFVDPSEEKRRKKEKKKLPRGPKLSKTEL